MELFDVNLAAVAVGAVIIFVLGGLWYSPLLFAKPWMALQGKTEEEIRAAGGATATMFVLVFICGLISSWILAMLLHLLRIESALGGAHIGALLWAGFVAPSSFATAMFSFKPRKLWLIDAGYYLVAYLIVGALLGAWH